MQSPHSRERKHTARRGWESWMDGVQWRHCLSDAAIILFPLGGGRAGHSVDPSAPTVEHHWTSSETRRWRSSSCFKAIKCSDFPSLQAESHSSLLALIKKCFCSQTPRQPLARGSDSNSISGAYVSGNHFNPGLPPECWFVLRLWAKERFEGVKATHPIADSMLSVFKTPLLYLNNSSHRGRATLGLCLLGKPDRRPLLITAT